MPGTINWNATWNLGGPQPNAEIYDKDGNVVKSDRVPCSPPVDCPFPMDGVQYGKYKAALASGSNRYYYVQGQPIVSVPNQESTATVIELTQQGPAVGVSITVESNEET